LLCSVSFMLSVANKPFMLSVIMLDVVVPNNNTLVNGIQNTVLL
jgi:hypothetical protein